MDVSVDDGFCPFVVGSAPLSWVLPLCQHAMDYSAQTNGDLTSVSFAFCQRCELYFVSRLSC